MASFKNVTLSELEQANLIEELRPVRSNPNLLKAGQESWTCAWSPDGSYFAWSCGNRIVKLVPFNRDKHTLVDQDKYDNQGRELCQKGISIDAGELVWALAFGSRTSTQKPHSVNLNWFRYHAPSDLILATGLTSGRIRTWNVNTGRLMLELVDHREVIRDLKFAPDSSLLMVSASRDGMLKVWDLADDGNMMKTLRGVCKWLYACAWSPDAKMLASVGDYKSILLWDMTTFTRIRKLEGHHHDVVSCDFSPDGALLVTSSYDTRAIIWDPHTGDKLKELGHLFPPPSAIFAGGANGSYVRGVSYCHDGVHIATVADDSTGSVSQYLEKYKDLSNKTDMSYVRFWNVFDSVTPEMITVVPNALCCSYSPDGSVLAVGTRNGNVSMWLAPMQVESLQHLCRMAIRRVLPSTKTDSLCLPVRIKDFLKYKL